MASNGRMVEAAGGCVRKPNTAHERTGTSNLFADLIIDKPVFRVYDMGKFIYRSSAAGFAIGTGGE